tara:strand:- start:37 stop:1173 length:1137 start_codon:yes stop_codon:yes gene_type:complete
MDDIKMVDLGGQYLKIKNEIDGAILDVVSSNKFINGPDVKVFSENLSKYLNCEHTIPCANGTDALQIALMSCDFKSGDEIICPAFTYISTAEVISLLGFKPVLADVDPNTFNITAKNIEPLITDKTKAVVPVHLYGQSCDMESIIELAKKNNLYVIEDNAQALGSKYTFSDGRTLKTGTIGDIGTTSFFPSKNLGCFGDGGAITTNNHKFYKKSHMISNHGQEKKYYHKITGCNSRLDTIQAAILNVKLKHLDTYSKLRNEMANTYDEAFRDIDDIQIPKRLSNSTHVFHQYTLKIKSNLRNKIIDYLKKRGIPVMIYYPLPLYEQDAFSHFFDNGFTIPNVKQLCESVFSLPIHTETENSKQEYIIEEVLKFFKLSK